VPVYQPQGFALYAVATARDRIRLRLAAAPVGGPLDHFLPDPTDIAAGGSLQKLRRRSAWASTFVASLELTKQGDAALAQEAFLRPIHVSAATSSVGARESRTGSAAYANRHRMSKTRLHRSPASRRGNGTIFAANSTCSSQRCRRWPKAFS
jgi:hypothetical protein